MLKGWRTGGIARALFFAPLKLENFELGVPAALRELGPGSRPRGGRALALSRHRFAWVSGGIFRPQSSSASVQPWPRFLNLALCAAGFLRGQVRTALAAAGPSAKRRGARFLLRSRCSRIAVDCLVVLARACGACSFPEFLLRPNRSFLVRTARALTASEPSKTFMARRCRAPKLEVPEPPKAPTRRNPKPSAPPREKASLNAGRSGGGSILRDALRKFRECRLGSGTWRGRAARKTCSENFRLCRPAAAWAREPGTCRPPRCAEAGGTLSWHSAAQRPPAPGFSSPSRACLGTAAFRCARPAS